ncbi:MAG: MIP/aquaporin family protein, partial [Candidatus Dormibacteraceae bacterium]
ALSGPMGKLAPIAIGSVLMVMVYMGGHISGGHYNPAVSFGAWLRRKIDLPTLISYWVVQLVGAALAFIFGYLVSGHTPGIAPGPHATIIQALAVEVVFTGVLVLTVLNVALTKATEGNSYYGLAIGFAIVIGAFAAGPISGGALNPAVGFGATLGKALFGGGNFDDFWIYVVGGLLGGAIAAGIHEVQIRMTERPATADSTAEIEAS